MDVMGHHFAVKEARGLLTSTLHTWGVAFGSGLANV